MGVYIEGMEMPKKGEWISVNISPDGKCFIQSWCGKEFNFAEKLIAVPVPPHGRLIDADALIRDNGIKEIPEYYEVVRDAPTIIPASFENPTKNARYSQDNPAEEGER